MVAYAFIPSMWRKRQVDSWELQARLVDADFKTPRDTQWDTVPNKTKQQKQITIDATPCILYGCIEYYMLMYYQDRHRYTYELYIAQAWW